MAAAESPILHLEQRELSVKDKGILADLEGWLSIAKFEDTHSGGKICTDEKLGEKWALLRTMDFIQKVCELLQIRI